MKPMIEISDDNREKVATVLNNLLADEYVLYTKTKAGHWNVEGKNFIGLHKLFEEQYELLDKIVDDVAERVRSLGHFAIGSLKDFLAITNMTEENIDTSDEIRILQILLNDQENVIRIIRNNIPVISDKLKDLGTADFITAIMEQHEKMAWMLRATLSSNNKM
jgi:starvation-inducible DNA-binding protein